MEWAVPEECVGAASTCMNSFSPRGGGCDISKDADTGTCMSSFFFSFEKKTREFTYASTRATSAASLAIVECGSVLSVLPFAWQGRSKSPT